MFAHTTLHVTDYDRSLKFYTEEIGLPVVSEFTNPRGVRIAMLGEGTHLELVGDGRESVDYSAISIGFIVEGAGEKAAALDEKYIGPISPNPRTTFYFIRDPDGFTVQLVEKTSQE